MRPKAMACRCMAAADLTYKSGGKMKGVVKDFFAFLTRRRGVEEQERVYGAGMRLHNPRVAKGKLVGWTCTICGERKTA